MKVKVFNQATWKVDYVDIDENNLLEELAGYDVIAFGKTFPFPQFKSGAFSVVYRFSKSFLNHFIEEAKKDAVVLFKYYGDYKAFCGLEY